ncbi:MAG: protein-disulfide reductase DsbD [Methylibium sp.]|uniref:protein-disulfide reductase DsbD n=1 Tax=Methylibium sp. TaxID=2067992 RepID=UPI0017BA8860|nr:protein-disulfide reductase DsbD [Methylibium sp.]MBA3595994.1 protein-disulfide reductase DsbD [Methylibium sp.]
MTTLLRLTVFLLGLLQGLAAVPAAAAQDFLPPEQAFRFEARVLDERSVEIAFDVADGYYMYREQFAFAAEDVDVRLGTSRIPAGTVKFDETFDKDVETHRGRVVIRVPVEAAPAAFTLTVTSQGCADAGLCYPPQQSQALVQLAGFGGDGSVRVQEAEGSTATAAPATAAAPENVPDAAPTAAQAEAPGQGGGIEAALRGGRPWVVAGVFFIAGLLLSLTPCVLPMLPILSSIIVGQSAGAPSSRSRGFGLAVSYSLGMALVYTAFGVAAGLAGEGLAAALQNPWTLGGFALLLTVLAMSMFGFYELQLPAALRDRLDASASRFRGGRWAGVFAMGGVSALIVSPCVAAPLAGALVYISQTRDVVLGGSALFSLAIGMSVPLLLLGASAGALLPRAGAWMESVKRFFGVLLLGVAWWILSPVLPAPLTVAGWGLLLLLVASQCGAFERLNDAAGPGVRLCKAFGVALVVLGSAQLVGAAAGATDALQPLLRFVQRAPDANGLSALSSTEGAPRFQRVLDIAELDAVVRGAGRPVMLDFYADWCVSCKEMEHLTFSDPRVKARLDQLLLLQADVTRNSPADRALLKRFGLFGPPGILFFDVQGRELASQRVIGYQNAERFLRSLDGAGL